MPQAIAISDYHNSIDEIDLKISLLSHELNATEYQLLVLIREFDERMGWLRCGSRNCAQWLQWRCDIGAVAAREKVRVANALADLPLISVAFSDGKVSYTKVRAMTRIATPDNEADLVALAQTLSAANLEQYCRQTRNASSKSSKTAKAALERRSCSSWCNEASGMMTLTLEIPIEEGQLIEKALEKAVHSITPTERAPDDKTSWSALRADAMVVLAKSYLSFSTAGAQANASSCNCDANTVEHEESVSAETQFRSSPAADHYQVMVHVDESALTSVKAEPEGKGEAKGQSQFPIEVVKRLCCDGSVVAVVENEHGEPLSVGRKQRTVSPAIRRALWARDGGCSFPGCGDTRFVEAHHIKHWSIGGETSVENCCLLCSHHHKLVHEGGFSVSRATPDQSTSKRAGYNQMNSGQLIFKRPDGRVIPPFGYRTSDWQDEGGEESPVIYLISNNKGKHPQHLPHPTDQ